jgi:hypothetical protein
MYGRPNTQPPEVVVGIKMYVDIVVVSATGPNIVSLFCAIYDPAAGTYSATAFSVRSSGGSS